MRTPLSAELETLVQTTIGCCIAAHRALGPGLSERVYAAACCVELEEARIAFEREKWLPVVYRGRMLCHQRVDILVEGQLIVEVKSVDRIHPVHLAQTIGYLRLTGCRVGLVVNFNVAVLKEGLRRVVL